MAQTINIGGIQADLQLDSGNLERGLANAQRALDAIGSEIKQIQSDFGQGAIGIDEYTARLAALNQAERDLTAAMNAACAATAKLGSGLGVVSDSAGTMTMQLGNADTVLTRVSASAATMTMQLSNAGTVLTSVGAGANGMAAGLNNAVPAFTKVSAGATAMAAQLNNAIPAFTRVSVGATAMAAALNNAVPAFTRVNVGAATTTAQLNNAIPAFIKVNAAANNVSSGFGRAGMAMMQVGYIADDLQYGFQGVVNNIAPLVYGLTGDAGIAAGAQIAAVGAYQLYSKWDQVLEAFGDTSRVDKMGKSIEGLKNRVKELADELEKGVWFKTTPNAGAALEYAEDQIKVRTKAEKSAKAMEGHETDARKKERERVEDAIGEGGYDQIKKDLADKLIQDRGAAHFLDNDTQRAKLKSAPDDSPMARALQDEARRNALKTAETMLGGAANDPGTKKAVEDQLRQIGHGDTADKMSGKKMTEKEQKKDDELSAKLNEQGAENERKMREEEEKKRKDDEKLEKMLNEEGIKNQLQTFKERDEQKAKDKKLEKELNEQGLENQRQGKIHEAQHAKEFDREAIEKAKKAVPGISDIAEQTALANRVKRQLGQRIEKSTVKTIEERLIGEGKMDKKDAHAAAVQLAEKGNQSIGEKIQRKLMHGDDEKVTNSQTFAASELANRVQGGVSNENPAKKHTSQFDQMIGLLTNIQKNKFFFTET